MIYLIVMRLARSYKLRNVIMIGSVMIGLSAISLIGCLLNVMSGKVIFLFPVAGNVVKTSLL